MLTVCSDRVFNPSGTVSVEFITSVIRYHHSGPKGISEFSCMMDREGDQALLYKAHGGLKPSVWRSIKVMLCTMGIAQVRVERANRMPARIILKTRRKGRSWVVLSPWK